MKSAWKCEICGYVHEGDGPPDVCPVCGAGAEMFSRMVLDAASVERVWRCTVCGELVRGTHPPDICPVCGAGSEAFELESAQVEASVEDAVRVVVVGAGIAGTAAIDHARRVAPNAELTLVSDEASMPYYRLNLTRLLAGDLELDALIMADAEWFSSRRVELVRASATGIDRQTKRVLLGDGRALAYDRLVLALGARPFVPPLEGAGLPGVCIVRSLSDAQGLLEEVRKARACAVIGGGLLGLEAAAAMARRGLPVTVLENQAWLLPRQLTERPARILESYLARLGVLVRSDVRARALLGDGHVERIELEEGGSVEADLVIVATGVRPELTLVRHSGLCINRGLVVDGRMVTSDPSILAAGDGAEHQTKVAGIWPVAYAQGRVAGHNAAVGPRSPLALEHIVEAPVTRLKVVATTVASMGESAPRDAAAACFEAQQDDQYVSVVLREGRVVGAILVGDARLASELEGIIQRGGAAAELADLSRSSALLQSAMSHRVERQG